MSNIVWNEEQAQETLARFCEATPSIQADSRLNSGVFLGENGVYIPYVYAKSDEPEEEGVTPERYVYVLKQATHYRIMLRNAILIVSIGIPVEHWRYKVPLDALDQHLVRVWEEWFKLYPEPEAF